MSRTALDGKAPLLGVTDTSNGQENDGTSNVSGNGQRYGDPDVARTADFGQDDPHIDRFATIPVQGDRPAVTGNAPGEKTAETYGGQRP